MIYKNITLLAFFLTFNFSFSQDKSTVNELEAQLESSAENVDKIKILEQLWQLTAYEKVDKAIAYANAAIILAKQEKNNALLAKAYEQLGIAYANNSNYIESNEAYLNAIGLHVALGNSKRISSIAMNQAINFKDQSKYDSALYYMEYSKNFMANDTILRINYNGIKAQILSEQGKYLLSLDHSIKAAELAKKVNDSIQYADNLAIIGDNNEALGNRIAAIDYLKESLNLYRSMEDYYFECLTLKSIGETYSKLKPVAADSAKYYLSNAVSLAQKLDIPLLEMQTLNQYAEFLLQTKRDEEAKNLFAKSLEITEQLEDKFSLSRIKLGLGQIALRKGNYDSAEQLTTESLKLKQELGLLPGTIASHKQLFDIYRTQGAYKKALNSHIDYKQLSDSLYNITKSTRFDELQTKFDTEKKATEIALQEEEIKVLNAQAENDRLTKTLFGIGMFSFLTIAGLFYFGFKQRLRKNRLEREKQEQILKQELEFKKKELASQTLHLVQKNTFIQEVKENLEKIKKSPDLFKIEFRRLVMLLKKESAKDKDWEVFKSYFSEVHNNFDIKIRNLSEDITEKDIRLASFLKMNLTSKEIASMLNVLPHSVNKSKYRLKKKLGLNKNEDLTQFLNSL